MLEAVLCLMPALALAIALLSRRYPGERALIALRGERRRARWPRALAIAAPRARRATRLARGGELIASSLAVRPPPGALAVR